MTTAVQASARSGSTAAAGARIAEPMIAEIRLQWWREAVEAAYQGGGPRHQVVQALAQAIARFALPREEFDAMVLKVVPLGRFGKPEDVAGMALFLASDYASFISAASIDIAGGMGGQIAYYPTLKRDFGAAMALRYPSPDTQA